MIIRLYYGHTIIWRLFYARINYISATSRRVSRRHQDSNINGLPFFTLSRTSTSNNNIRDRSNYTHTRIVWFFAEFSPLSAVNNAARYFADISNIVVDYFFRSRFLIGKPIWRRDRMTHGFVREIRVFRIIYFLKLSSENVSGKNYRRLRDESRLSIFGKLPEIIIYNESWRVRVSVHVVTGQVARKRR